jgi:hypothetical protein
MTKKEFKQHLSFHKTQRIAKEHKPILQGKRFVKGAGLGYQQVLKHSRVIPQVGLERYFGNSIKQ